jgi:hypothetical protein
VTIHLGECRECLRGQGKRGTGPTQDGSWNGPYASVDLAMAATGLLQPLVRKCKLCLDRRQRLPYRPLACASRMPGSTGSDFFHGRGADRSQQARTSNFD